MYSSPHELKVYGLIYNLRIEKVPYMQTNFNTIYPYIDSNGILYDSAIDTIVQTIIVWMQEIYLPGNYVPVEVIAPRLHDGLGPVPPKNKKKYEKEGDEKSVFVSSKLHFSHEKKQAMHEWIGNETSYSYIF